jgi:hypothetical protein
MKVLCPSCGAVIAVPEERAQTPKLQVKCRCHAQFALSDAKPAPEPAAAKGEASVAGAAPPVTVASAPAVARRVRPVRPGDWRHCATHRDVKSHSVCRACRLGYCQDCVKWVGTAALCPTCEGLCVAAADYEVAEIRARQRGRSMQDEIQTIATYPLIDPVAYVLLALFTWFFGLFRGFSGVAVALSQGVLMAYSFTAVARVANANLKSFTPDLSDPADLSTSLRLGFGAFLVSSLPLIGLHVWQPHASLWSPAATDAAFEPEGTSVGIKALLLAAFGWKFIYAPVALVVAGMSRSFLQTLNPLVGIGAIQRMGSIYWQTLAFYSVVVGVQAGVALAARVAPIPIAPGLLKGFVDAYAYLVIGCMLGFAVFKKAPELGLE